MAITRCVNAFAILVVYVELTSCAPSDSERRAGINDFVGEEWPLKKSLSLESKGQKWKNPQSGQETSMSARGMKTIRRKEPLPLRSPGSSLQSAFEELGKSRSTAAEQIQITANSFRTDGKFRSLAVTQVDLPTESSLQIHGNLQSTSLPGDTSRSNSALFPATDNPLRKGKKRNQAKDRSTKLLKGKKKGARRVRNRKSLTRPTPVSTTGSGPTLKSPKCFIIVPPQVRGCPEGHAIDENGICREIFV